MRIACRKATLEDELTTDVDVGSVASSVSSPSPTPADQADLLDLLGGQAAMPDLISDVGEVTIAIPNTSENLLDF